jgi:hypothetical protein
MKNFTMILLTVLAFSATGCKTTAENHDGKIIVEDGYHRSGNFCPPGQAKKGNC